MMDKGAFAVSIDTEMAWGVADRKRLAEHYTYDNERGVISDLLGLLDKYEIRGTWSVVGHLFLDRWDWTDGIKHSDIVRPPYS